jgi:hypothetical protein
VSVILSKRRFRDRFQGVRELRDRLVSLQESAPWTRADAEAFWQAADKVRFS